MHTRANDFRRRCRSGAASVWFAAILWALCTALTSSAAAASPPRIDQLTPRGLQIGAVTRLSVRGDHLTDSLRLFVPGIPGIRTQWIQGDRASAELHVELPADTVPGIYPLRLVCAEGVSNAVAVGIDALPQLSMRDTVVSLPVALHGSFKGAEKPVTEFAGRAGERLVIDVEGKRLGSAIRPVLRLFGPDQSQLMIARPTSRLAGDTRLELTLPTDGIYRVELQDLLYRGPEPGWFRMKLGQLEYADLVFPMAVDGRQAESIELIGINQPQTVLLPAQPQAVSRTVSVPWTAATDAPLTGAAPELRVRAGGGREWRESAWRDHVSASASINSASINSASTASAAELPWAVNGRLLEAGEVDVFNLPLPPLADDSQPRRLRCEVFADRWGSPLDAVLEVLDGAGKQLGRGDDQPGTTDPLVDVTVPAGARSVELRVSSLTGNLGTDAVYRLAVTAVPDSSVKLTTSVDRIHVPAGSRIVLPVDVVREGNAADVWLSLSESLAPALRLETRDIGASDQIGLVALAADRDTRGLFQVPIHHAIVGSDAARQTSLVTGPFPGTEYRPDWRGQTVIVVTAPASLSVDWQTDAPLEYLARGTTAELTLHMDSQAAVPRQVEVRLLTTQRMPQKQVDNKPVDDLERALRLAGEAVATQLTVPPGHSRSIVKLHVPADLPLHAWGLAIRADVIAEEGKSDCVETVFTPVARMRAIAPLELAVDWPEKLTVKAGAEDTVVVRGRVTRHPEFRSAVTVTALGLGDAALGDAEQSVEVRIEADQQEFEFAWRFAQGTAAREIKDVRLRATPVDGPEAWSRIEALSTPATVWVE
jgi:hypothetical protein